MPSCCAPGCHSGYRGSDMTGIAFHRFPLNNPELLNIWLMNIPRENFTPTPTSRICSLHFLETDYVSDHSDMNRSRGTNGTPLQRRILRKSAFPSLFPNVPNYIASSHPLQPSSNPTCSSQLECKSESLPDEQMEDTENEDVVDSLDELQLKYQSCAHNSNFLMAPNSDTLVFINTDLNASPPRILHSVKVHSDLRFDVFIGDTLCAENVFSPVMRFCRQILRFSDFLNLLTFLSSNPAPSSNPLKNVVQKLEDFVATADNLTERQVAEFQFLGEQLLLAGTEPSARRYSPHLYVKAIVWHGHSPACYRAIQEDGALCLPSVRSLQRLTHNLTVPTDNHNPSTET